MTSLNPEFVAQVTRIAEALDRLDYFQLLRIERTASSGQIRSAYHAQAAKFHPDRYHHFGNDDLNRDLTRIAKRISEAYLVLRAEDKRAHYIAAISGSEREANLRYRDEQQRQEKDTAEGTTHQGRQMYHQARAAWNSGDRTGAINSLKMAVVYEPGNEHFATLLAQWREEVQGGENG